ncbi:MAG: class I SAM-dependent methyltransferase [Lachnospiraceae bacterium]|nr:class I SAM-dependent methyltransferase [Lachnospiraceae bacterium]
MTYWNLSIPVWEQLQKKMTWTQLDFLHNKKILDFGSGKGITADHFAEDNEVTAVEPNADMLKERFMAHDYIQLEGSLSVLKGLPSESFDAILCHNVLEYAPKERPEIVQEFARLLKPDGILSILKHNRAGRVMQMAVLLNQFDHANALLDGNCGQSAQFGAISYYEDTNICEWAPSLTLTTTFGMRTFWDLQQNQDIQSDPAWQQNMLALESRVSTIPAFQEIAFFHHLLLTKK